MKNYLIFSVVGSILFLSGCAASRNVAGDFISINKGEIPKSQVQLFVDCVSDKFRDRTIGLQQMLNRQQQRSDGYRVELVNTGIGLLLSADISLDGHVELFQRNPSAPFTSNEREGFA